MRTKSATVGPVALRCGLRMEFHGTGEPSMQASLLAKAFGVRRPSANSGP
jgi:hypothetical protein